ncbi:SgcJ/EcaC family oxidoreductase [Actinomadura sp. 7K507]|uniref:SgcJ/EcaC family oxidoreductase n=1 Tax=Actinomadura sp. 7K507 TaxID=2530365 RepID=UPI00105103E4|nr:SgcJ/EcaC family oxidoreductase [Actinomadura sp. 7K507]TDC94305.1 SgcJ/EcaC family oxidoreductase [Actinomadura sp. 7K507]
MPAPRRPTSEAAKHDQVTEVVQSYESAFNRNDAKAMNALFSEDTVFVNFGGNLVFGADLLYQAQAHVFAPGGALEGIHVRYSVESVLFLSPDIAVVHARQRSATAGDRLSTTDKDPMESILQMTLMQDVQGRWRVRAAQNTPVTAPPMKPDGSH